MVKMTFLSINQLMSIDWLDDSHCNNYQLEFLTPARFFLQQFENVNEDIESLFFEKNTKIISKKYLSKDLPEITIAILNPRIIHHLFINIPSNINYLLPAIKLMFMSANQYLISVEYIIKEWTKNFHDLIANIIPSLNYAIFSKDTIKILLSDYLMQISNYVFKRLNLANIPKNIIENALIQRAFDFECNQLLNSTIEFPKKTSEQIVILKKDLPKTNLKNCNQFLINFLVNKKLENLTDQQIQQIPINVLQKSYFDKLFNLKLKILSIDQINQITYGSLYKQQVNNLIIERSNDLQKQNITQIQLKDLEYNSLNIFLKNKMNEMNPKYIKNQITIKMIYNMSYDIKKSFLQIHINNLTIKQVQGICITDEHIAAILLYNSTNYLLRNQIAQICELNISQINAIIHKKDNTKSFLTFLRMAKKYKYIPSQKFNSIIDFSIIDNIVEVLNEDLQNQINEQNAKKIDIPKLIPAISGHLMLKFVKSCAHMLTDKQIQDIDVKNIPVVSHLIINNYHIKFSIKQVTEIDLTKLNTAELKYVIIDHSKFLTKKQLNLRCITTILDLLSDEQLISLLELHVNNFESSQIQAIENDNPRISAILLVNRANDLSIEQIQAMNLSQQSPIQNALKEMKIDQSCTYFIKQVHHFHYLTENQLNNTFSYKKLSNVIEVLNENLQDKITPKNIKEIDIISLYQQVNTNLFSLFFDACCINFSQEQINTLSTNDPVIAQLIIKNNLFSQLNKSQKNNFNKDVLFKCTDSQLSSCVNIRLNHSIDALISGLLIFRYVKSNNANDTLTLFINNLVNRHCFDDICLAKLVLIAQETYSEKGVVFSQIAKDFFEEFKQISKKSFSLQFSNISITPNDFQNNWWQKFLYMDINNVSSLLEHRNNMFSRLPYEYRLKMKQFKIGELMKEDGTTKKTIFIDTSADFIAIIIFKYIVNFIKV